VDVIDHVCTSTGKYSEWNEDNPIHFVGHSAGAQVIRMLQQMLADKVDYLNPSCSS
jgi:triacylglycerol esterase/lipase EstA (alpha/beta hydrolase family)